jgi:hypothetical protein
MSIAYVINKNDTNETPKPDYVTWMKTQITFYKAIRRRNTRAVFEGLNTAEVRI